jgi:hypothetical protein
MTITQPSRKELEAVDWEGLKMVEDLARRQSRAGTLTPLAFNILWKRALKYANGSTDQLETVAMYRPAGARAVGTAAPEESQATELGPRAAGKTGT